MNNLFGPEWQYQTRDGDMNFHGAVKLSFDFINSKVQKHVKDAVQDMGQNKQDVIVDIPIGDAVLFRVKR